MVCRKPSEVVLEVGPTAENVRGKGLGLGAAKGIWANERKVLRPRERLPYHAYYF